MFRNLGKAGPFVLVGTTGVYEYDSSISFMKLGVSSAIPCISGGVTSEAKKPHKPSGTAETPAKRKARLLTDVATYRHYNREGAGWSGRNRKACNDALQYSSLQDVTTVKVGWHSEAEGMALIRERAPKDVRTARDQCHNKTPSWNTKKVWTDQSAQGSLPNATNTVPFGEAAPSCRQSFSNFQH